VWKRNLFESGYQSALRQEGTEAMLWQEFKRTLLRPIAHGLSSLPATRRLAMPVRANLVTRSPMTPLTAKWRNRDVIGVWNSAFEVRRFRCRRSVSGFFFQCPATGTVRLAPAFAIHQTLKPVSTPSFARRFQEPVFPSPTCSASVSFLPASDGPRSYPF
jgi:hypothetical protein